MGQRFLRSKKARDQIIAAADLSKNDIVLEVGPGEGFLTEALAERAGKVIAVEKDKRFVEILRRRFRNQNNIEIIEGDILDLWPSLRALAKQSRRIANGLPRRSPAVAGSLLAMTSGHYKIVANIPYYLTSRFLRLTLKVKQKPELMALMVQREVAERIVAKPPQMNMLALSVQAYGKVKRIANVPRGAFSPQPRVDSAIIKVFDISNDFFEKNHIAPERFFALARRAFAQKRKMLSNSLGLKGDTRRPQELSLKDWIPIFANA